MAIAFGTFLIVALVICVFGIIYTWRKDHEKPKDTLEDILSKLPSSFGDFYVRTLHIRKFSDGTWQIGYEQNGFKFADKDLKTAAEALLLKLQEYNII